MTLERTILVIIMLGLLVMVALCAGAETALFSLTQADRLRLRKSHARTHGAVMALLASPQGLLVSALLAVATLTSPYMIATSMLGRTFSPGVGAVVGAAGVLGLILLGEVLPKGVAAVHRVAVCRVVAGPMLLWHRLITPVRTFASRYLISPLVRLFVPAGRGRGALRPDELSALLEVGAREGTLEGDEQVLLDAVVQLSGMRARDVMTPRVEVRWLDAGATSDRVLELARTTRLTRFPLCRGALAENAVAGVVTVQSLLPLLKRSEGQRVGLAAAASPARYIPERARLDQVLDFFRETRSDLALCVGESGEITGLITIDDVIRALVTVEGGSDERSAVRRTGEGRWEVSGRLSVRDWAEFFRGEDLRSGPRIATVAGLIFHRLGRVPRAGDEVRLSNLRLRVESMRGRVVERVSVVLEGPAPGSMVESRG